MGGIKCITPSRSLHLADSIKRLTSAPTGEEVGKLSVVELLTSENVKTSDLQQIFIQDLNMVNPIPSKIFVLCLPGILTNPCVPNPCQNDGTCSVIDGRFMCFCSELFSGEFCETGPCQDFPCLNGGVCKVENRYPYCECKGPFIGYHCEINPCIEHHCDNGGSCVLKDDKPHCECKGSFTGQFCDKGKVKVKVVSEGPPALMDFDECVTDLEICQFLTGAAKSIVFYQYISEAISLLVKDKKFTARPALLNNDKETREKIALLQKQEKKGKDSSHEKQASILKRFIKIENIDSREGLPTTVDSRSLTSENLKNDTMTYYSNQE
ncbi:Abnormal pharyngeal pumping eat-20 [Araneus ventricosus]|uniref:Abnormal pharyngeal pumping eat-20 n=1 Tax=Araneus ventricosus TaxID=182803 RepID=A0A4Y2HXA7_ARAVE|nr:Abnormal pharyngeal pumping eat-20 [Araneus ventricosus]